MRCAMCGREMYKAAAWVGGLPIGPKCWQNMGDKPMPVRSHVVRNDQPELFDDVAKDEASE